MLQQGAQVRLLQQATACTLGRLAVRRRHRHRARRSRTTTPDDRQSMAAAICNTAPSCCTPYATLADVRSWRPLHEIRAKAIKVAWV